MVAHVATSVIDNGLASLKSAARYVYITTQEATTYTEAESTYAKGVKNQGTGGVFPGAISAGTGGRKVTTAAFVDGLIAGPGSVTHWAITDDSNLLAVGALSSSLAVTSGNFGLSAIDITINSNLTAVAVPVSLAATSISAGAVALGLAALNAGADVLLQTLTLENYNPTVATPTNSYLTTGLSFKKGDMPAGKVPELRVSGTPIPAQFDLRSSWPDGSLRWCECSCVTTALAGAATRAVQVWRVTGSYNNTNSPARNLTDVNATGGHDFKVVISALTDYLGNTPGAGGTLTADFNTASAVSANTEVVKQGPVCRQWKTWMFFPGQQHLAAWFYVTAWTNPSGGALATVSHIAKVHNGFTAVTGATRWFYDAAYRNGATTIRSWGTGSAGEKEFTRTGTLDQLSFASPHGLHNFQAVTVRSTGTLPGGTTQTFSVYGGDPSSDYITMGVDIPRMGWFTTSGTLPGGLTANYPYLFSNSFGGVNTQCYPGDGGGGTRVDITSLGTGTHTAHHGLWNGVTNPAIVYWVRVVDANTIQLTQDMDQGKIPLTSSGSGQHFIVPRIFHQCHSAWFTADIDGRSDWTSNEATIHVRHDKAYLISTRMIPPYDLAVTPASDIDQHAANGYFTDTAKYVPMDVMDLRHNVNDGGTHNTICPIPSFNATAFLTQTEKWATRSRINALLGQNYQGWIDESNGKIPPLCGPSSFGASGSFTGLATPRTNLAWGTAGTATGGAAEVAGGEGSWYSGGAGGTATADWSHHPDPIHYTIVTEGGCHLIDSHIIMANGSIIYGPGDGGNYGWYGGKQRVKVANGHTYYGLVNTGQGRSVAWELRTIAYARATCPDNWVEAPYLDFLMSNTSAYSAEKINVEMPSSMKEFGWWEYSNISYAVFMHVYLMRSVAFIAYLTENANAQTWAQYMIQAHKNAYEQSGTAACYQTLSWCGTTIDSALPNYWYPKAYFSFFTYLGITGTTPYIAAYDTAADSFTLNYGGYNLTTIPIVVGTPLQMMRCYADNSRAQPLLPDGFAFETTYYVQSVTGSEPNQVIKLSATPGGAVKTYTTAGDLNVLSFGFTGVVSQPNGIPAWGDSISTNNSGFTEALGSMAEAVHYGFTDLTAAYNAAYALAIINGSYALPGIYQDFPNNPMWAMRPQ